MPLVEEGFAGSLSEAAIRFAISHPAMGTILVGMATPQQFEQALAAVQKGPLPQAALDRLATLQQGVRRRGALSRGFPLSALSWHFSTSAECVRFQGGKADIADYSGHVRF